jgi:trimeric autotransporter adhesin
MKRLCAAAISVASVFCAFAGTAVADQVNMCVPTTAGQPIVSNGSQTQCTGPQAGDTAVALPSSSDDQQTLLSLLPHVQVVDSGVGGKPTIRFSGVNVQVVSGSGATDGPVNGVGNLVVGYAENSGARPQTGSNDLILGTNNSWTGFGEIVGGTYNVARGAYAAALGVHNIATGANTFVTGAANTARGAQSSVLGGRHNIASGIASVVAAGVDNHATDLFASVLGGCLNYAGPAPDTPPSDNFCADHGQEAVLGGASNTATGWWATIAGGGGNVSSGTTSSVSAGDYNTASAANASVTGGEQNQAGGTESTIAGGAGNSTATADSAVFGGCNGTDSTSSASFGPACPTDTSPSPFVLRH